MSEEEKQSVEFLLQWIQNGGLSQWIEHYLNEGDEAKLKEIKGLYDQIKQIFGF